MVIDMMLDMARDEEIVDIHNTVRDLRARRVNMVQTEVSAMLDYFSLLFWTNYFIVHILLLYNNTSCFIHFIL